MERIINGLSFSQQCPSHTGFPNSLRSTKDKYTFYQYIIHHMPNTNHLNTHTHALTHEATRVMQYILQRTCIHVCTLTTHTYPAKSTKCSLDLLMTSEPGSRELKWMVNIQWDLVDAMFIGVYKGLVKDRSNTARTHHLCYHPVCVSQK